MLAPSRTSKTKDEAARRGTRCWMGSVYSCVQPLICLRVQMFLAIKTQRVCVCLCVFALRPPPVGGKCRDGDQKSGENPPILVTQV